MNAQKGKRGFVAWTTKSFKRELQKVNPDYELIGKYKGYDERHTFRHKCGQEFSVNTPGLILRCNARCPCLHKRRMQHTATSVAQTLQADKFEGWSVRRFKSHKEVTFEHTCGNRVVMQASTFINTPNKIRTCSVCRGSNGMALDTRVLERRCRRKGFKFLRRLDSKKFRVQCKTCKKRSTFKAENLRYDHPCGGCRPPIIASGGRFWRKFKYRGRRLKLQGVEDIAYKWLVRKGVVDQDKLVTHVIDNNPDSDERVPVIRYQLNGKNHHYTPDMYDPETNTVIEAKDVMSLGLFAGEGTWFEHSLERNRAKAQAAIKAGFNFMLIVCHRELGKVWRPKDWIDQDRKQLERTAARKFA